MGVKVSSLLLLLGCVSLLVAPCINAARVQKEGVYSLRQEGKDAPSTSMKQGTDRPLIGIMSQPCHDCPGKSYIAAAFVKWVEAAGGRPVPIRFYNSEAELYRLFKQLNGLVFPGGLTWLWLDSPYVLAARKLFQWAVQANDAGDPFPIYGTCLGFQLLHILASNVSRNDLLVDTDSTSHATTLKFWNKQAAEESLMFGDMPEKLRAALESEEHNIVLQNHMYGLPPPMYKKYPVLSEWYNILSTSKDRNGVEYVSTIEGKKYPFFGTQWHPEKPPYEFGLDSVPHSLEAIKVSQSLGSSFIETAKKSSHKPESKEQELELLIYDVCPVFSARFEVMDEENYDGPDMTFYLDHKDTPPVGPDDEGLQTRSKPEHPEGFFLG
mmetsp:Transcript_28012/g.75667  ORF Transcript_28012/g.75667 Transcript_28012/m.75667 type:complete len:381 (+) Transcript_28012:150-1292(+)